MLTEKCMDIVLLPIRQIPRRSFSGKEMEMEMEISPTLNFKDKGKVSDNDWIMILDQMIFPLSLFLPTTRCTTTPYVMTFDLSFWCHSFGLRQIDPLEKWMQETSFSLCLCACACVYIAVVQELCVHVWVCVFIGPWSVCGPHAWSPHRTCGSSIIGL